MAIRAVRVIAGALVIPVADHTRGKDQQRDERQGNSEDPNRLLHSGLDARRPGCRPLEYL